MSTYPLARSVRLLFVLMALIATILAGCGGGGGGDNGGGNTDTPPTIVTQPQSLAVDAGDDATFTVQATGDSLAFQWQRLDSGIWENLSGANANAYTVTSAESGDAGSYRVVVSNSAGTATSNAATLTVSTPGTGGGTVIVD
ncbi:MAG: immunoglobulin domain-containing protein [Fimbriimonas sp.]